MDAVASPTAMTRQFAIRGMTCGACVKHIERALRTVPGVESVQVSLADARASVTWDAGRGNVADLAAAVKAAGYELADVATPTALPRRVAWQPIVFGLLAVAGLLTLYLGLITLAQGWEHALNQLREDRWFVGAIAIGFGTQVGLFTYLRALQAAVSGGGVAASTGTSTTAMLACCAHHLADVLPVIGLSGAAVFLNVYKTPLLWLGITMNLAGATYLLWQLRRQRTRSCHVPAAGAAPAT